MDYRQQLDHELTKLISYHEKEYANYVSDDDNLGTDLDNDFETQEQNEEPHYSVWSSEHFIEKIKPMAMVLHDYDIVGKCEILLAIITKIQQAEEKAMKERDNYIDSLYQFDHKTYLENKLFFSASDIGCYFGYISAQEVNKKLIEAGLQVRTNEGLIPTTQGQPYHLKTVYTPAGSKTCRWDKAIVHVLAMHLGTEPGLGIYNPFLIMLIFIFSPSFHFHEEIIGLHIENGYDEIIRGV
ncbi:hypothetical protein [Klebsiella grimontii]|uniref:Uncharacterized protein n=1 Tax=Klebsiella grimontii TaxID=2058152 RepID=A0A285AXB5_9ENTR|nr:hypothetical protein [Klebsiella grimontii]SNU33253.1 hypothetical protein KOSB73_20038 [Klebsiella grimontii]